MFFVKARALFIISIIAIVSCLSTCLYCFYLDEWYAYIWLVTTGLCCYNAHLVYRLNQ